MLELINRFVSLCDTFAPGDSFHEAYNCLAGKNWRQLFKMKKKLYQFIDISIKNRLDVFDKLIDLIFCYGADVWGYNRTSAFAVFEYYFKA